MRSPIMKKNHLFRTWAACALAFLILLALPCASRGDETETVRVGYYENEVFQEGAQEGAVKTGYAYEYYRKLTEYTGWNYEYVYGSFGELLEQLLSGEIDLLAGLAYTAERAEVIAYPDAAMGSESYSLLKHSQDDAVTEDPATLNGMRIGVLDSALRQALETFLSDHKIIAQVIPYDSYEALFEAFDGGELDILAAEGDGAYGRSGSEVLYAFGASDYYLCVSGKRPDLLSRLNTAQQRLAAEEPGYLLSLHNKYYPVSVSARAFSTAEKEWKKSHEVLRVGYLEHYLPYSDTDDKGQATGIVSSMIPDLLSALDMEGMRVEYTGFAGYDAMIGAVTDGRIDVAFPVGGGLYYSEENGIYQSVPAVSTATDLIYKGEYSEQTAAHFAVNKNNRMQYYYVRTYFPQAEISLYPSIEACLDAVNAGHATCTTLNGLRSADMLRNRHYRSLSALQLSQGDDRCFGVKIGSEGLLKLINRGISILGSDYAQNMAYRYMDGLYSYNLWDILLDHMAFFGSLALVIAALVIFYLIRHSRRIRREAQEKEAARVQLEEANRELRESKEALSRALDGAEQASRAKTAFLSNMSHDIRTPMNAIVGFTALASTHIDDKEQVQDYLERISVSGKHLLALINDVLDMSRIESGKMTLEEGEVSLPELIGDLDTILQPTAAVKDLELTVDTSEVKHSVIVTDRLRLHQVLLNILNNAVKFTPGGGKVSLKVTEKPSSAPGKATYGFRISDNGIGMSEEFQKTIFEAFTRERTSTVSGIQGTGLGMAISKKIVDMMGGTITVRSKEGEGSEFAVDLPCRIGWERSDGEQPGTSEAGKPDFTGKRVLLAEDNEMNQMIATAILREAGITVEVASDGAVAVEKMKEAPAGYYGLILMDIQMPHMDGYEAARQIRALADPEKARIPILAVTANAFEEDRKTALDAGMNGHLAKPYDIPQIMETLAAFLK